VLSPDKVNCLTAEPLPIKGAYAWGGFSPGAYACGRLEGFVQGAFVWGLLP